ncbi:hypothetical protein GE061_000308 [Apolygus lucorum]|uniref:THAP-type domain-containing protein n=1 Tax=Apolygus lucorum TaxID=248454 RepID=A0A8S9Y3W8_APOLU|nr:hypothetical protein GE061_000307 [Apolygus lucorum]KAF6215971.1 hypothetical protein GE061_000308 [Apolygus lucorum]
MAKPTPQKRYCRAPDCDASSDSEKLFQSPPDPVRLQIWKDRVGLHEPVKMFYICRRHFSTRSFKTVQRTTLLRHAVPSYRSGPLNPLTGDYSGTPLSELGETIPLAQLPPALMGVTGTSCLLQISTSHQIHQSGIQQNEGLPSSTKSLVVDSVTVEIEDDKLPGSTSQATDVGYVKSPILQHLDNVDGNTYSYRPDLEGMGSFDDISDVQYLSDNILTRVDVSGSPLTGANGSVCNEVVEQVPDTMTVHPRPLSTSTPLRTTAKKLVFDSALSTSGATFDRTSSLAGMSELGAPLPQGCTGTSGSSKGNSILRLIGETRYSSLTPRKQKLVQEVRKQRKSLGVIRKSLKSKSLRLQSLEKSNRDDIALVERFASSMSLPVANLVYAQVRNFKRKPRARRWTVAEKLIALSLYKRAPRSYRFLATMFTLPTPRTLVTLLNKVPLKPGINSHVFDSIKQIINKRDDSRYAYCALLWDEMSIREHLEYIPSDDLIWGYEDLGNGKRSNKPAHHALVFMAVGLFYQWKQPLAYYFTPSNLGGLSLVEILRSVLSQCNSSGLLVKATICDGHSVNRKVYQLLGSSSNQPWFTCEGIKMFTLFDPPHLLKCTRNMFVKHDLSIQTDIYLNGQKATMTARWQDIIDAYDDDCLNLTRSMHKITRDHLEPKHQKSMKVNLAAQIFSRSVTATLETCVRHGILQQRASATAEVTRFFNDLFDSLNGYRETPEGGGVGLRCRVQRSREEMHLNFWSAALEKFTSALKTCLVNKLADDDLNKGNCEGDVQPQEILESLQRFLVPSANPEGREPVPASNSSLPTNYSDSFAVPRQVIVRQDCTGHRGISCAYVCGFSVSRLLGKHSCEQCRIGLVAASHQEYEALSLIEQREFSTATSGLSYPSRSIFVMFDHGLKLTHEVLERESYSCNIRQCIIALLSKELDFAWWQNHCPEHTNHIFEAITVSLCRIYIPWWCKCRNRAAKSARRELYSKKLMILQHQ